MTNKLNTYSIQLMEPYSFKSRRMNLPKISPKLYCFNRFISNINFKKFATICPYKSIVVSNKCLPKLDIKIFALSGYIGKIFVCRKSAVCFIIVCLTIIFCGQTAAKKYFTFFIKYLPNVIEPSKI